MKKSVPYRSMQVLSQQVAHLEASEEVRKITFSLPVKSCELCFYELDVDYSLATYIFHAQKAFNKRQR